MRFDQPADEPMKGSEKSDNPANGSPDATKASQHHLRLRSRRARPVLANRQLLGMILLLIGVLYAMQEAGKPERWHWLIPPTDSSESQSTIMRIDQSKDNLESPANTNSSQNRWADESAEVDFFERESADNSSSELARFPDSNQGISLIDLDRESDTSSLINTDNRLTAESTYPSVALEFWQDWLRRSSAKERKELYLIFKRIRFQQPCPQLQQDQLSELIDKIKQQRETRHDQLFQNLSYASGTKKQQLTSDLFESQQVWQQQELPALQAFIDESGINEQQRQQFGKLQTALDATFYRFVQDQSAQGWEGDSPAWGRMWELNVEGPVTAAIPVTHLELSSQPSFYRGRVISASGWVQAARREPLTVKELDIDQMYVLVVKPSDSNVSPYFVYSLQLPDGFPDVGDQFQSMNEPIQFEGRFFKIRTYPDSQNKVQNAPMILATSIQPMADVAGGLGAGTRNEDIAEPLTFGLIILPLIAIFVAWWLFRITDVIRFKPGPNRTAAIRRKLDDLSNDPDIKTDRERIDELYQ